MKNTDKILTNTKNYQCEGFSLIELSIVLIILGLLVAGVTGGASLIKSAKIRSVCNDYLNYKNAYNAYYAQFGERAGTQSDGDISVDTIFLKLVDEKIIDSANWDGDACMTTGNKLKSTDASFCFLEDEGNIFNEKDILLYLSPLTSEEGKSILKKLDNGEGNTGGMRATYVNNSTETISEDLSENTTDAKYNLYMKMDF